mgnify:CR=1 FL=1
MTPFPPELEALMPEPAAHIHSDGDFCWERKPAVVWWPENLFTANQVRQAMLDATERAAKKCDEFSDHYTIQAREGDQSGASDHRAWAAADCAAAIRGGGQG